MDPQTDQRYELQQSAQYSAVPAIVVVSAKSMILSLLLTFFFGPLGMLYSTVAGAMIMIVISCVVGLFTFGFGLFLIWPICIIWGAVAVSEFNRSAVFSPRYLS